MFLEGFKVSNVADWVFKDNDRVIAKSVKGGVCIQLPSFYARRFNKLRVYNSTTYDYTTRLRDFTKNSKIEHFKTGVKEFL